MAEFQWKAWKNKLFYNQCLWIIFNFIGYSVIYLALSEIPIWSHQRQFGLILTCCQNQPLCEEVGRPPLYCKHSYLASSSILKCPHIHDNCAHISVNYAHMYICQLGTYIWQLRTYIWQLRTYIWQLRTYIWNVSVYVPAPWARLELKEWKGKSWLTVYR
jgi:hypothetical protein